MSQDEILNLQTKWLESHTYGDFRIWHLIFFGFSCVLCLIILFCCLIRIRIPRTKQEIEGNYQRKKIARKFRQRLAVIDNSQLDEMDLRRVLEYIRADYDAKQENAKFNCDKNNEIVYNLNKM